MVVIVDEHGVAIGTHPRATVHTLVTPRHLAFSLHLVTSDGHLLVTRRSVTKHAWPGVWTNACCGHPLPGEAPIDAAVRRAGEELGLTVREIHPVLPDFSYRAVDPRGIVEDEICPVFVGRVDADPAPDPDEVEEWTLAPAATVLRSVTETPWLWSPWFVLQAADPRLSAALDLAVARA
ncbi:isopentenyl-diphosphate Delta-isomerase [Microbacterium gorillae]|uniref:isopentenyl-diphosphate Delta-isomerase n=1 Tax=Microbacterium gorillae TaxID=1231063 RepID=UPI000B09CFC2|nr:isopentenyl-diphosphate Delta-isomerase [Microbacterium gorillae]